MGLMKTEFPNLNRKLTQPPHPMFGILQNTKFRFGLKGCLRLLLVFMKICCFKPAYQKFKSILF